MKYLIQIFLVLGVLSSCSQQNKSMVDKTMERINSIETIEFSTSLNMKNFFQNDSIDFNMFLDFTSDDTLIGARYILSLDKGSRIAQIYNGESLYDFRGDTIYYEKNPHHLLDGFLLQTPIFKTKYLLKEALNDSTVSIVQKNDTIINNIQLHNIEIRVIGKYLVDGKLQEQDNDDLIIHEIYLRKDDYLPVITKTLFKNNEATFTSTMKSINENYDSSKLLWNLEDFSDRYTRIDFRKHMDKVEGKLIIKGEKAKSWVLPDIEGENVTYDSANSKLTLLEFWFTGCGACDQSQPYLNNFHQKYKDKGLDVFAIEFGETDLSRIKKYVKHEKINYPVLYSGKDVAELYGATGAPTFVLIDKEGYVVYVKFGFKAEYMTELENEIDTHLYK